MWQRKMSKNSANSVLQILSPYGNWSHSKGMQIVDEIAGEKIVNSFSRSFTRFWGLPIYVGHPDEKGKGAKAVGRVESISLTKEGIVILASYSDEAFNKLISGKLKWLSPRWQMQDLGKGNFRPVKLISVGMTNNPNIKGSGKLLSPAFDDQKFLGKISKIETLKKINTQNVKTLEKLARQADKISEKSKSLNGESLDVQIKKISNKLDACELAKLAIERSKKTGESYVESFCAVRRKYFGTNVKNQTQRV